MTMLINILLLIPESPQGILNYLIRTCLNHFKSLLTYGKVFGDDPKEKKKRKRSGRFLKTEK